MKDEYRFMQYGPFMCLLPWRQQVIIWIAMILWLSFLAVTGALVAILFTADISLSAKAATGLGALLLTAAFVTALLGLRVIYNRWLPRPKNML